MEGAQRSWLGPRWRRRSAIAAMTLVAIGVVGLVLLDQLVNSGLATDADIVEDDAQLATTVQQLDAVGQALDALPALPGTDPTPAERWPCRTDSGGLFQPYVSRVWTLDGGRPAEAAQTVGGELAARGWTVSEPGQFGDRELVFDSGDGWQATGLLFTTFEEDAVVVEVQIAGATPCHLR